MKTGLEHHLAVYDYGMGGVWILIEADSPEAVERRFPWLRVVSPGHPPWITEEKYREIVDTWISANMRFELSHPTGWLAESDANLGPDGATPTRAPRWPSDPPADGPMRYQRVIWDHDHADDPVALYAEIDFDGFENRKVHEYRDGRLERADRAGGSGATLVSDYFVPDIDAINAQPVFSASTISPKDFEAVWLRAARP